MARERADPASLFNLYRRLIAARRKRRALSQGAYRPLTVSDEGLVYLREAEGERVLVALNFGAGPAVIALPGGNGAILVATEQGGDGAPVRGSITLAAGAGAVVALGS